MKRPNAISAFLVAVLAVLAAWGLRILLDPLFGARVPFFTFFPALFVVAWWGGFRPTLIATLLSVGVLLFFIIPPLYSFRIDHPEYRVSLILYFGIGMAVGWLGEKLLVAKWDTRQALRRAERESERLRVTLASIGDAVVVTNAKGRIISINAVCESLTGWSQAEARGKPLVEVFRIINQETRQAVEDPCAKVLRTGSIVGLANHTLLIAKDGSERPIDDSAAPILDEAGAIRGVIVVFRDVAINRQAELELRHSERELSDFFENAALPLHATGPDGIILRANQSELDMLGYSCEEYIGHHISEFHVDPQAIGDILARLARGEVMHNFEARLRAKDGSIKDVLVTSSVQWENGKFIQNRCFTRDITSRKRAEESLAFLARAGRELAALADRESALQLAAELPVPILADWCVLYIVDERRAGGIELYAHAHCDPDQEELLGKMLRTYPLDWNSNASSVVALRTGKPQFVENLTKEFLDGIAHDDRHREMIRQLGAHSVISVPLRIRDQTIGVIGLVAADPNRRYTSRELGVAASFAERVATAVDNARLYFAVKDSVRQKDEFLAMLAHELRNPLAAIRYAVDIGRISANNARDELFDIVDRQSHSLARLIDDLLDVSRISSDKIALKKEPVDVLRIIRGAAETVRPIMEQRRHEVNIDVDGQAMPIFADPTRAEQIVANLLTNAAKYTREGGRIQVRATLDDGFAVITVADNGIGLSPEMCSRVFELFAQADRALDRSEGGLGIGLTLARKLAEMHGGDVGVESPGLGHGSTFTVRLPLAESTLADSAFAAPQPASDAAAMRILVVDDNRDTTLTASLLLKAYGHEVETANDGPGALEAAHAFRPHAFILDIGLPGMSGYEVAQALRQNGFENAIIVAVSGYGQEEDCRRSLEAGFDHHFVKPVDYPQLLAVLQNAKNSPALAEQD